MKTRARCVLLTLLLGAVGHSALATSAEQVPLAENPQAGFGQGLSDAVRWGAETPAAFIEGVDYDPSVPTPEGYLGFPLGARPATHAEIRGYCRALAEASARIAFVSTGWTHEGRELFALVAGSAEQVAGRETLRAQWTLLSDPRVGDPPDLATLPACIWMGACVHGNEPSGSDAALFVAHYLAAARNPEADVLRHEILILIDPLQNPDGHDRVLAQWRSLSGRVPDDDDQSMRQWGVWPGGRTNHYLFDLNRDWFYVTQPESRARTAFLSSWHPQVRIDAHEMGGQNTYLFSPPREPFHPAITDYHHRWWQVFETDHAAAFDARRWDYYTRAWHEEWFPGYGTSWSAGIGAVGILYEQASTRGGRVARRDGTLMTYRDTVHHQIVSFLANLETAAAHRAELLAEYRSEREASLRRHSGAFLFDSAAQPERAARLCRALRAQGIELSVLKEETKLAGLIPFWSDVPLERVLAAGSVVVVLDQPQGALIETILGFDPHMDEAFLRSQRLELEKKGESRIYDVTAWSLSLASGLPAYRARRAPTSRLRPLTSEIDRDSGLAGELLPGPSGFGFLIDGEDDRVLGALLRLWERDVSVFAAREPFTAGRAAYSRGTLLIKRGLEAARSPDREADAADPDPGWLDDLLAEIAAKCGVQIVGVGSALTEAGPDLGGGEFKLLPEARIAVLAGAGVSWSGYGEIAWLLDTRAGTPFTPLAADAFHEIDLGRYNVLVMPDYWSGPEGMRRALGEAGESKIKSWVRAGGTLIGCGKGAAWVADSTTAFGSVRLRRQQLSALAEKVPPNPGDILPEDFEVSSLDWAKGPGPMDGLLPGGHRGFRRPAPSWAWAKGRTIPELEAEDARLRLYHPRGAVLWVDLDPEAWLTTGCATLGISRHETPDREWMPAPVGTGYAYLATDSKHVVGAFGSEDSLRLGGLLWPEARQRWAETAYLTREPVGRGQIILFASTPCMRGAWNASQRAFLNAVILGPGMGGPPLDPY